MITIKKIKSLILAVALFGGMAVFAQAPQQMTQEQPNTEGKDAELEQFATVSQNVMQKNQEVQQKMLKEIEKVGLTGERYTEIQMAAQNPAAAQSEASKEELEKKEKADEKIQKLEQQLQQEQVAIVEDGGMTVERFQQIANAVQSDQNLMEKYQKIIMEKAQNATE